ncbi:MAG: ABC transporter permease [Clostridiales bacterium]|jgi:ABC-2 type transport system permease protein|nr:ABC transporter permease [Clostridiales bacterium]
MFSHLFTGRLKCLLRNKTVLFWTLLFPMLLSTLFFFALGSITEKTESFSTIPVSVVENDAYRQNQWVQEVLKQVSQGDDPLLALSVNTQEEAQNLLREGRIDGYLVPGDPFELVVKQSGINQSILKAFIDELMQTQKTVERIVTATHGAVPSGLLDSLADRESYVKEISPTGKNPDTILNYFYALIAMTCLYSSFWGLEIITGIQGNLSSLGARRGLAPTHKLKGVLADFCAAVVVQFVILCIVIAYMDFVLGVNFGDKIGFMLITCLVGSVMGVSLGGFISAIIKKGEGVKVAVLIMVSMLLSFLSGLMMAEIKDLVATNMPLLAYLNPANLIADSFYSLYFYDTLTRFGLNTAILCGMTMALCVATYFLVRRQKYASV